MPMDKNNQFDAMRGDDDEDKLPPVPSAATNIGQPGSDLNNTISRLQKYLPQQPTQDVVPYDPNAGTLTNIGRFALNNAATDQFGGGVPGVGAVENVAKEGATEMPNISKLLTASPSDVATAQDVANAAAKIANKGQAGSDILRARTQNVLSRAVDLAARNKKGR